MQVGGEKRLRDVWEKIKEHNVSGGVQTIIGQVNTHTHTHTKKTVKC